MAEMISSPSVAVLGGGPAGAVAALTLARGGVDTLVLEVNPGPTSKIGETLPPSVLPLLERLELLSALDAAEHRECTDHRSVWGSDEPMDEDFLFGTFGAGMHVDRERFEGRLAQAAIEAGADWRWGHHAVDAQWIGGRWRLVVEAPEALISVEADFVIDATGRHARFARGAGAQPQQLDKLVGVAVILEPSRVATPVMPGCILVEAQPEGWWYSAPLSGGRLAAVFMTDGDQLRPTEVRKRGGWHTLLASTVDTRERLVAHLDGGPEPNPRIMPVGSTCLRVPSGHGWLAVGDAAAAFDPLSSYGMSAAMTTGHHGACAVSDHLRGKSEALMAYDDRVVQMFEEYLDRLHEQYTLEQRWPYELFWSRRHERLRPDPSAP